MTIRMKSIAILLGSTALATSISFDVVAGINTTNYDNVFETGSLNKKNTLICDALNKTSLEDVLCQTQSLVSQKSDKPVIEDTSTIMSKMASKPLVIVNDDGTKTVNPHFQGQKETVLKMNALSYAIAKRQSASDKINKWITAFNSNSREYSDFMEEINSQFSGYMDMFDILEDMDFQDRHEHIKKEITILEAQIQLQVALEQSLADELNASGWDLKAFEGKSGYRQALGNPGKNWVADDRGFVAFHKESNIITVILHGSRDSSDWDANFDSMKVKASKVGLTLPGDVEVHRGFGNLVASCKDQVADLVQEFYNKIEANQKSNAQIYVSGHSLGAALATLMQLEITTNVAPKLFGETFNNIDTNNVKGVFFSTPRAVGKRAKDLIEKTVGKDNMIRQNVNGDPVPVAAMKKVDSRLKAILKWIEGGRQPGTTGFAKIPLIGKFLEKKFFDVLQMPQFKIFAEETLETAINMVTGYDSVGHLALDNGKETVARLLWPATKAMANRTATNFTGMVKGYWGALVGNNVPNPGIVSFITNTAVDVASTIIAPLHYGTTMSGEGGAFEHKLPAMDTDHLLNNGDKHLTAKIKRKSWWANLKSKFTKK